MRNRINLFVTGLLCVLAFQFAQGQQTVGLFQNESNSFEGYTLFAPLASNTTYLIDNCGRKVHEWQSSSTPGNVVYLLENGQLLHTGRIPNSTFNVGGYGGRIELIDFNSNSIWSYDYSNNDHCQHHDVEYLPNGNILLIAWEKKTRAEAIAAGRDSTILSSDFWPDEILEITPVGSSGATIVWEWHAWDHIIQDRNSGIANYGIVADHPELINLNYANLGLGGYSDWMHTNSVSYNPTLDQIILSVHNFHEVWVIDHSTTTAEAAGHTGGNSGKGGDILYRWGNPQTYGRGTANDKQFFGQHDAQWVPSGDLYEGQIIVYNNGIQRPGGNHSTIDIIDPPIDSQGKYQIQSGQAFAPTSPSWTWQDNPLANFFSSGISGVQRLPGNHSLICEGISGHFFELDSAGTVIWDYISPVNSTGPQPQGDPINGNSVFRCYRYAPNYPGLAGQTLNPFGPIELNPLPPLPNCSTTEIENDLGIPKFAIAPNPFGKQISIQNLDGQNGVLEIWNSNGICCMKTKISENNCTIETNHLPNGIYIAKLQGYSGSIRIVKLD